MLALARRLLVVLLLTVLAGWFGLAFAEQTAWARRAANLGEALTRVLIPAGLITLAGFLGGILLAAQLPPRQGRWSQSILAGLASLAVLLAALGLHHLVRAVMHTGF